jgi:hypothetical protein
MDLRSLACFRGISSELTPPNPGGALLLLVRHIHAAEGLLERSANRVIGLMFSHQEEGKIALGIYVRGSSTMCIDFRGISLGWKESSRTRLATAPRAIDFAIMTSDAPLSDSDSMSRWSERILLVLPSGVPAVYLSHSNPILFRERRWLHL